MFAIDDQTNSDLTSNLGTKWRLVTDTVMGGVSQGQLRAAMVQGRRCWHMTGDVSLENNGGFVQASLDLGIAEPLDASGYSGIELEVYGNEETYNVHLRTTDTRIVWQSYRASFFAKPHWKTVKLPFDEFQPHRITVPLDIRNLRRIGVAAIGRVFHADLSVGRIVLYA